MKNQGVTLVELIVVIAIIGILAVALGFSYQGWQGSYKVEKTTKDLFTDLMDARTRAMTRNRMYFAVINATSYSIIEDTNDNTVNDDAALPTFPKQVEYALNENFTGNTIIFTTRGVIATTTNPETFPYGICVNTTANPDYDCIVVSQIGINMGKLTTQISAGGACDATNCVAK